MSRFGRLLLWCLLPACAAGGVAASARAADAPRIRLGYLGNLTHAQALLGLHGGDFARSLAPAVVVPRLFNAGPAVLEALFADEIDLAYIGPGPALNGYVKSRGEEVRVVAGAAANGVVIVAAGDSDIRTLDDLKGKRLATPQMGNTQDISARHFVRGRFGIPALASVVPVPNAEQAALMLRGRIAAAWVPEPWGAILMAQAGARLIAEEKDLWPDRRVQLTVLAATRRFVEGRPELLERFLTAHLALTAGLRATPNAAVPALEAALTALAGRSPPAGLVAAALPRIAFDGAGHRATFSEFAARMRSLGYARTIPALDGLFATATVDRLLLANPLASEPHP